jgi:hypothetical protein
VTSYAVYVATTEGPVQIQRITREPAPRCAVCLGRTTKVLPISGAYDAFVRPPSGVIEREFGPFEPGAFRLDVSAPIGGGESWQLAFFVAHALAGEAPAGQSRLAGSEAEADAVLWFTGRVDHDLVVGAVDHVARKLQASGEAFERWRARGLPVTLFVPEENAADVATPPPTPTNVVPIADVREVLEIVIPAAAAEPANVGTASTAVTDLVPGTPPRLGIPRRRGRSWRGLALVIVLAVSVGAIAAGAIAANGVLSEWRALMTAGEFQRLLAVMDAAEGQGGARGLLATGYVMWLEANRPRGDDIDVAILERVPPANATCAAVHYRKVKAVERRVRSVATEGVTISSIGEICGLSFVVRTTGPGRYVAAWAEQVSRLDIRMPEKPGELAGRIAFNGRMAWSIDFPRRLRAPLEFRLTAVTARYPVAQAAEMLRARGGGAEVTEILNRHGATVLSLRHRTTP